jgi:signal transduction histidine kinase
VVVAAHFLLGSTFRHSIYLLCLPLLVLCAGFGGAASAFTATLALGAAGVIFDGPTDLAPIERISRLALFVITGFGLTALVWRGKWSGRGLQPEPGRTDEAHGDDLSVRLAGAWNQSAINEMASVLSHELNQPLAALANYLRASQTMIARLELKDDALVQAVTRAGDQAIRAGQIVRTMRELTTRGGTQVRPESLSDIIREIVVILNTLAREPGVKITYQLFDGDDVVMADRIQIQQLVVNLVRNAIQALDKYPNGKLRITTVLAEDGELVTSIEDNGPGIDPSVLARPFMPLSSTSPDRMGLGLSICSAIVANHKGRIWVESGPEGGAAFRFGLPRAGGHGGAHGRKSGLRRR